MIPCCHFCGRPLEATGPLVTDPAGNRAGICEDCARGAVKLFDARRDGRAPAPHVPLRGGGPVSPAMAAAAE
ncbi:MAG TPA: ClpX C4-type zinc finger protein [Stellaceae bacterium]|nr:ClpX C4-type zinc finger protein [Stellaceae bacterium]